jgi:hypothetical protein
MTESKTKKHAGAKCAGYKVTLGHKHARKASRKVLVMIPELFATQ